MMTAPSRSGLESRILLAQTQRAMFGAAEPVRLGRYELGETIGSGAMGVVVRAEDPELSRSVAIKILHTTRYSNDDTAGHRRLRREAKALGRVAHPNVVEVYDVGEVDGRIYIAMEWIRGRSLERWLRDAPRSWTAIRDVLVAAGRGLHAAHEAGVVHRDFKPSNVQVGDDGRVRVLDFGLAMLESAATPSVTEGSDEPAPAHTTRAGTPRYMAPELLSGHPADPRSDQYAFGVTLNEALEGVRGVPRSVRRLIHRATSVGPGQRFASLAVLLEALVRPARPWKMAAALTATVAVVGAWTVGSGATEASADVSEEQAADFPAAFSEAQKQALNELDQLLDARKLEELQERAEALLASPDSDNPRFRAWVEIKLCSVLQQHFKLEPARDCFTRVFDAANRHDLPYPRVAAPLALAQISMGTGDIDEAARWVKAARSSGHGLDGYSQGAFRLHILDVLIAKRRGAPEELDEALEVVEFAETTFGPNTLEVAKALGLAVGALGRRDRLNEALELIDRELVIYRAQTHADPRFLSGAHSSRAKLLATQAERDTARAPELYARAIDSMQQADAILLADPRTKDSPDLLLPGRVGHARILVGAGRFHEAIALLEPTLAELEKLDHIQEFRADGLQTLGAAQAGLGQTEVARATLERARLAFEEVFGPEHPATMACLDRIAELAVR